MNRLIAILIGFLTILPSVFAQNMSEEQIKDEVYKVVKGIQSLQCDFVQTKTVKMLADKAVATGSMAFQSDKKLRWVYKTPFEHVFILNETQVLVQDKDNKDIVNIEKSRIFKEVSKMIKEDVVGQSFKDGKTFMVSCSEEGDCYVAVLTTLNKKLKDMFASMILRIDRNKKILTEVELSSSKGDKTVLSFQNIVINKPIDDTLFNIN